MQAAYERDGIQLYVGDCREVVPALPEPVSAVVTDPPYGLSFMGKDWDHEVPGEAFWRVFSDAMLPGAHLLSFGGTRTQHRIAVAIEDAGFEIRDTLMWLYGSGFPKSHDVSKAIDKLKGAEREVVGIKPKSRADNPDSGGDRSHRNHGANHHDGGWGEDYTITAPATPEAARWQGFGTALKPSYEPVIVARKPLSGTVAQNVLAHGTGALNIDQSRIPLDGGAKTSGGRGRSNGAVGWQPSTGYDEHKGRWPANVILDPDAAAQLDQMSGERKSGIGAIRKTAPGLFGMGGDGKANVEYGDTGGASRFFKVVESEAQCLLCLRTYAPKHGILNATQEVAGCNHVNSADGISLRNESRNGSAPSNAQELPPLDSEASSRSNGGPVSTAASSSGSTPATRIPTADESARDSLAESLVPRVSDAASLCERCTTATARSLASLLLSHDPVSPPGLDSMPRSTASILTRSLASFAEPMVNTGIIPTTASLSILFGSVQRAISESTSKASAAQNYESAQTRWIYTPKASPRERNAGLDGMPERCAQSTGWSGDSMPERRDTRPGRTNQSRPQPRAQNHHPTVKPLALCRWLLTLVTPPGGIVLDPFVGSGSTLVACAQLGIPAYGIDMNEEYIEIAARRIDHALNERAREGAKPRQLSIAD